MGQSEVTPEARFNITIPWWDQAKRMGAGDAVSKVTSAAGIKECGGCKRRRKAMNRLIGFKGSKKSK